MRGDQFYLRRKLRSLNDRLKANKPSDQQLAELEQAIEKSQQLLEHRRSSLPVITYPEQLPIAEKREVIAKAISENQVVVVAGETGSGKTTQLPKICLQLGRGINGLIGHTQPRRLAARTVAARIAEELNSSLGEAVGYQVRFSDQTSDHSYIKLMTDGILLAEIQNDRYLNQYDTIIIDEAHERSLNIDFLLGALKTLRRKRRDLKIVITSATIDPERFQKHFDGAPIVMVEGRTYPVDVRYRPLVSNAGSEDERDIDELEGIRRAVDELWRRGESSSGGVTGPGNALIFLAGERQINETQDMLEAHFRHRKGVAPEIRPLYSRLPLAQQQAALAGDGKLRIVLATNVAETSLTVPGIRYVIDAGTARISRYSVHSKVQRLPVEPIARASADQRAGRSGIYDIRVTNQRDELIAVFRGRSATIKGQLVESAQ